MDAYADLKRVFDEAGLPCPPVPPAYAERMVKLADWHYSSRSHDLPPDDHEAHYAEIARGVDDYLLIAHAGHGVNSYFLCYYLVHGPFALLLKMPWGGVYQDEAQVRERIAGAFAQVAKLIELADEIEPAKQRIIIFACDALTSWWQAQDGSIQYADGGQVEAIKEVVDWAQSASEP